MNSIESHIIVAVLSAIAARLPDFMKKEDVAFFDKLQTSIKDPVKAKALKELFQVLAEKYPSVSESKFAGIANFIVSHDPSLAPYQPVILELLENLNSGVQQSVDAVAAQ